LVRNRFYQFLNLFLICLQLKQVSKFGPFGSGLLKRKKPSYVEHAVKSPRTKSARLRFLLPSLLHLPIGIKYLLCFETILALIWMAWFFYQIGCGGDWYWSPSWLGEDQCTENSKFLHVFFFPLEGNAEICTTSNFEWTIVYRKIVSMCML
jgi:hypothetical protein